MDFTIFLGSQKEGCPILIVDMIRVEKYVLRLVRLSTGQMEIPSEEMHLIKIVVSKGPCDELSSRTSGQNHCRLEKWCRGEKCISL